MGRGGASFSPADESYRDLTHGSTADADRFYQKAYDAWQSKLTQDEFDEIQRYTGAYYYELNNYLRNGYADDWKKDEYERSAKLIDSGLSKFVFPENVVVHRYSSLSLLDSLGVDSSMSKQEIVQRLNAMRGSVITDKGVVSTATHVGVWSGSARYDIQVPKGTSGAYVRPMSHHKSENEVILNKGTSYVLRGASIENGELKVDLRIYREGRAGRQKQVRYAGDKPKANGSATTF